MEDLSKEMRAIDSLRDLLKAAENAKRLHDEAGMEYPAPLRRVLGVVEDKRSKEVKIPAPDVRRPNNVPADWISVPIRAMKETGLVLGVLRRAGGPVPVKQIVIEASKAAGTEMNGGTIANIGTRLATEPPKIQRNEAGWRLLSEADAPILDDEYAWGPKEIFVNEELTARRREAIVHVLKVVRGGLQPAQILAHLSGCDWLGVPVNADMIKADMKQLRADNLVKLGAQKKWVPKEV